MKVIVAALMPLVVMFDFASAQSLPVQRSLIAGRQIRYQLRQRVEGAAGEIRALAELNTVSRDGRLIEEVRWVSLVSSGGSDGPVNLPPYDLAANPRSVVTQGTWDAAITGIVTDFYTFFFAVSPAAGIASLKEIGQRVIHAEPIVGDWADGEVFLLGKDFLAVTLELKSAEKNRATVVTSFTAPDAAWTLAQPWMEAPVCETQRNNFQMVRKQGGMFLVVWGCERFTIESVVDTDTGLLRSAHMDNVLSWRIRMCQDAELTRCVDAPGVSRQRSVDLDRMD